MKKNIIVSAAVLTIIAGATLLATKPSFAAEGTNPEQSLVQKLASKFGLKQEEVQSVFDEHHKEMKAEMETKKEERLSQLVKDGKITEAQKQLIINKQKELQAKHEAEFQSMKDKTPEERKAAMEKNKQELEDWAKQNNIDIQYLGMFHMRGHGPMMRRR
jgi:hypothetical protein